MKNCKKYNIIYYKVKKEKNICGRTSAGSPNCASKIRRKVERPSREELKFLIKNYPFTQIGKQFGVSDNTIRKWCISENLPNKSIIIKSFTDEEWDSL